MEQLNRGQSLGAAPGSFPEDLTLYGECELPSQLVRLSLTELLAA